MVYLDPLSLEEYPQQSLSDNLVYGCLPRSVSIKKDQDREEDLKSYAVTYLEEEVRAEALVRENGAIFQVFGNGVP